MSGELPEGWAQCPLGEATIIRTGKLDANAAVEGGRYPFFTCADEVSRIDTEAFDTEAVLLAGNGTFGVKWYKGKFNAYQRTYVIEPRGIDGRLLYRLIKTSIPRITSKNRGSTIQYLRLGDIADIDVSLPPLNEQKRIVAKIDALTEKSREARQALDEVPALLDKLRQSILAAAFRGDLTKKWREQNPNVEPASVLLDRIRKERRRKWEEAELTKFKAKGKVPSDDKWKDKYVEPEPVATEGLPELPEGWCWASVEELATLVRNGISTKPSDEGPLPILRISSIRPLAVRYNERKYLPRSEKYEPYLLENGDVLFTRYNGNPDLVGVGAVVEGLREELVHPDKLIRVKVQEDLVQPYWLAAASAAGKTREHLYLASKSAAGQIGISGNDLKTAPVPLAPFDEQQAIILIIRSSIAREATIRSEVSDLAKIGQQVDSSILAKAFRGELVPQDPNDEPASVLLERIRQEREDGGVKKTRKGKTQ